MVAIQVARQLLIHADIETIRTLEERQTEDASDYEIEVERQRRIDNDLRMGGGCNCRWFKILRSGVTEHQ
jgi:hypothetical protein